MPGFTPLREEDLPVDQQLRAIQASMERLDPLDPRNDTEIRRLDARVIALKRRVPPPKPTISVPPPPPCPSDIAREAHEEALANARAVDEHNHRVYEISQSTMSEAELIAMELLKTIRDGQSQVPPRRAEGVVTDPAREIRAQVGVDLERFDRERVDLQRRVLDLKIAEHGSVLEMLGAEGPLLRVMGIEPLWEPDRNVEHFQHRPAIGNDFIIVPALIGHNDKILRRGINPVQPPKPEKPEKPEKPAKEDPCPSPQP